MRPIETALLSNSTGIALGPPVHSELILLPSSKLMNVSSLARFSLAVWALDELGEIRGFPKAGNSTCENSM